MLAIISLFIFIPIALLPLILYRCFSPEELSEMGVDTDLSN